MKWLNKLNSFPVGLFLGAILAMVAFAFLFKSCAPDPVKPSFKKTEQLPTLQHVEINSVKAPNPVPPKPLIVKVYVPVIDTLRIHDTVPYFYIPAQVARLDKIWPNGDTTRVNFRIPEMKFTDLYFNRPDSILKVTQREYYQQVIERLPIFQTYAFTELDYNIGGKVAPSVGLGAAANLNQITMKAETRGVVTDGVLRPFLKAGVQYNF